MDWLKELLGEELYNQVKDKLGDTKIMKDDGNFIPKSRFDQVNEQIESFSTKEQEYHTKLNETKIDSAIEKFLLQNSAKYPELISSKFDRNKIKIAEDGTVEGVEEQGKAIQESYKELFGETKMTGGAPNTGGGNPLPKPNVKLEELAKKARMSGRMEDRIAYAKAKAEAEQNK